MKRNLAAIPIFCVLVAGCHTDMWVQPKHAPMTESEFYGDGASARPLPDGTVAYGKPKTDAARFTGRADGKYVDYLPTGLELDEEMVDSRKDLKKVLKWGQERFQAYCSHCHGETGRGDGMITQRGLSLKRLPANYHSERLRKMPLGYFFYVISNGFGIMLPQSGRIPTDDRWAIAAYIRALQFSQNAPQDMIPEAEKAKMNAPAVLAPATKEGGH